MNDLKIREATVADIPQMCSIFQNDLGYTECTQEIVEKQFAGIDAGREAVFVAEVQLPSVQILCMAFLSSHILGYFEKSMSE